MNDEFAGPPLLLQKTAPPVVSDTAPSRPSNMRRRVILFGSSLAFLSFLDRAAISQAAPLISRDLGLSSVQMGLVFSAFGLTYALGEIPSGWLCDRLGARHLLTRVVVWWSLFTAATGLAWSFSSLLITRLLFGAGESGCFPGLARVFRTWLPVDQRNSAEGIKAACARFGAAVTPTLMAFLFVYFTWREVFFLFGAVGIFWAMLFHRWYRDRPSEHPGVNEAELQLLPKQGQGGLHGAVSWRKLAGSKDVWLLGAQWFSHYYGFYFYITWLPIYLLQARGLDIRQGAFAAGLPLFAAGIGSFVGGWSLTRLSRHLQSTAKARKLLCYFAYGGAAAMLLVFTRIQDPVFAIAALSVSSFAAEFSGPVTWTTAMDIGGEKVGTVSGFMNMLGHFGGSVAPAVTGLILAASGNAWNIVFYCSALIYAAGGFCWIFLDPVTQQDFEPVN